MEQTMSSIRFDKAQYIKSLRNAGQTQEAAEAFADALDKALEQSTNPLATKVDFDISIDRLDKKIDITAERLEKTFYKLITAQTLALIAAITAIVALFGR
ncbi:hypothetical protein JP35_01275 [Gallibacterium anatis]|uniref:hypothetical protein n=1 Tax=Gallibacterium anatis TaxID=750 RepID=UPI0005313023|nr:hypothetical protein [Gallibacterium anatis]KGQ41225.1 hypothetical protein JP35_01275 [Gallibacterium anatis]MBP4132383.1 hypothetical protein [Gallibacterium anatis]WIM84969.1 hypothetical protein QP020_02755 [Gallibacterium anatis]